MRIASFLRPTLLLFAALAILTVLPRPRHVFAQPKEEGDWSRLVDLRGNWHFRIGLAPRADAAAFDDAGWQEVFVPARWEDEGFPGYDGFAWYRRTFHLDRAHEGKAIYLHLGRIDDVDRVYVNGELVGASGGFPALRTSDGSASVPGDYRTAYHLFRTYRVPSSVLRFGKENVVSVLVFDAELAGGMLEGAVGLYERVDEPPMLVDLTGTWRFHVGDDRRWSSEKWDDRAWDPIQVPLTWSAQGYEGYDGHAWYRREFRMPSKSGTSEYVLVLGYVDDLDETFVNGVRVGSTGDIDRAYVQGSEWQHLRAYPLPPGLLRPGERNTVAVRVYDGLIDGGIYRGPVGIMTSADYERHFEGTGLSLLDKLLDWWRSFE